MIKKHIDLLPLILAGDNTHLKEVLSPGEEDLDLGFSLAHAFIRPGEASLPHILDHSETYYFLEGVGKIVINSIGTEVEKGNCIFVPAGALQYVENKGPGNLSFLCIVSPPWIEACERIIKEQ